MGRLGGGRVRLEHGDCLDVLPRLKAEGVLVDGCITDPPYHLTSIVKRFGADNAAPAQFGRDGAYARASAGFMGKRWDGGDVAFRPETWRAVFDVMKPGAHLIAFGGTRTYHRMASAIEDAGFEIRDLIAWLYGSGFPKSHNLDGEWEGWGTALKPALEPICFGRKPLDGTVAANIATHGVGALNIDACRVPGAKPDTTRGSGGQHGRYSQIGAQGRIVDDGNGRWPANVLHDGGDDVVGAFPDTPGQQGAVDESFAPKSGTAVYGDFGPRPKTLPRGDTGSAARFFYSAKADAAERVTKCTACGARWSGERTCDCSVVVDGKPQPAPTTGHPTVKPVDLMRWCVRLITPPGGVILDPFAGTGTTGEAAMREGMRAILIEREAEYAADIRHRLGRASGADTPLFAGAAE